MNVFDLRDRLVGDYAEFISSFLNIQDPRIKQHVEQELGAGRLWPEPLIQLNPSFEPGGTIDALAGDGTLHSECQRIFRRDKDKPPHDGREMRLHLHQAEAVRVAKTGANYVLTTGTGSGKSLAYILPIVDHVLREGSGRGIQAVIVYPMNALANSQELELEKFLKRGYPAGREPVTFERYTGQEKQEDKERIVGRPPDILLTNYVMLELILTRPREGKLIGAAKNLRFLVLDELHTYRGRQGADVAMLVRRAREAFGTNRLQCVGTSATIASGGTFDAQRREVARVATLLFGAEVKPEHVIGETLRRSTPATDISTPAFQSALRARVLSTAPPPSTFAAFVGDPLSVWIESALGLQCEPGSGRLQRKQPRSIEGDQGAAQELADSVGVTRDQASVALRAHLLSSYRCEPNPETGFPVFAFRLHQFISRGDNVYATVEPTTTRGITLQGQVYFPGSNLTKRILPLVFCRDCGQEYYCAALTPGQAGGRLLRQRDLSDQSDDNDQEPGFLYLNEENPWPDDPDRILDLVPEDWVEEVRNGRRVRPDRRELLPSPMRIAPDGTDSASGVECHFVPAPFRFCLNCGVSYDSRQRSDFAKLAPLGMEGRSTATTVLSLGTVRYLRAHTPSAKAQKLLSFTDNRQDASLQAGHFNDFVEIGLLRSALYRACLAAGPAGLSHDELAQAVFKALDLPLASYAVDPNVRFQARAETDEAFRKVLGYRLYRDLKRGWRITAPNLEQCGLLEIRYPSLDELCRADEVWFPLHACLGSATPQQREEVCKALLDHLRRELAVKSEYLDREYQERIVLSSGQRLKEPWAIDEREQREFASTVLPRSRQQGDSREFVYLSSRGSFGSFLRRSTTFPSAAAALPLAETERVIRDVLEALRIGGFVHAVLEGDADRPPGYQVVAASIRWFAGDGTRPYHDVLRKPRASRAHPKPNTFFQDYYASISKDGASLRAREHTAAVPDEKREEREQDFREGRLPLLYCSPTMELGIDISELNVVNMRNVPPTPANYAQRSGRAGRSGQPALVFTYCSSFSSHDQYFFKRPERMVSGAVAAPRLDVANADLLRAHVHALWIAAAGMDLRNSLSDIIDVGGDPPSLKVQDSVLQDLHREPPKLVAKESAKRVLATIQPQLDSSDWYTPRWLDEVIDQIPLQFERALKRWRGLYLAAIDQRDYQTRIINDHSRNHIDRERAKQLRAEAESQIELLLQTRDSFQSDFYSYRYFASEGFLPGYSFPRLPLSAYIPGRRAGKGRNEYISRPRFLAISEFGPRAILYHEGARFRITRVIMPVDRATDGPSLVTTAVKKCAECGYLHPIRDEADGPDQCERCNAALGAPMRSLFRLQNVSTIRADRINCDEEERQKLGYDVQTAVRFEDKSAGEAARNAQIQSAGVDVGTFTYGHAATLWRVNLGWRRRSNVNRIGFMLDASRGQWARSEQEAEDQNGEAENQTHFTRVVPYVEDHRNALLFQSADQLDPEVMASLQAAFKTAIQTEFQLEEQELAAEPLPDSEHRRLILFFESAEGGAGVLRRLIDDPDALRRVARTALELCHFDPDTGDDRRKHPRAREDCEAACYDCLMSFGNQRDHEMLNRHRIKDLLLTLAAASVQSSPAPKPRADHLADLKRLAGSDLERRWLDFLEGRNLRLPDRAQEYIEACRVRPDFTYSSAMTVIYIDGPVHEFADRAARDRAQQSALEDLGYTVIRFSHADDWERIVGAHPNLF